MVKDVVCNMEIDENTAAATSQYDGKTYYFCAPGCKKAFAAGEDLVRTSEKKEGG